MLFNQNESHDLLRVALNLRVHCLKGNLISNAPIIIWSKINNNL